MAPLGTVAIAGLDEADACTVPTLSFLREERGCGCGISA